MGNVMGGYSDISGLLSEFGEQIRRERLRQNFTTEELSMRAGVSRRTIGVLEGGGNTTLETLVRVLRVLQREDWLLTFQPPVTISPLQIAALGRERQRARKNRSDM
jgi:transcriptional regulator with XRE-family HTH domain